MPDETDARVRRQLESHLTFAAAVLSSPRLAGHRRELDERLSAIRARHADQSLYLAVVGEFSSGKSTFINALIGEPLLPTSAAITTAVPTELAPGAAPEVRLQLAGAERTWVLPRDNAALRKELGRRGVSAQIPADARDALKSLVVSDEIGALVSSVRYTCQGDFLGEDIVVIDTPGLDASDDHDLIAQRVVADRADAFVVLTASNSAFRRYLEGFLRSSLKEHLHQSVFVVTKMDQVDDDEIARFERVTSQRLRRLIEPATPGPVHYLALGPALSAGSANAADWAARFELFRSSLREQLKVSRALVVSDNTARLLDSLLARISELVARRRDELAMRERQLEAITMPDVPLYLAAVSNRLKSSLQARFSAAGVDVRRESASIKLELTQEIGQRIDAARSMSDFRIYVDGFGVRATKAVTRLSDYAASVGDQVLRQDSAELRSAVEDFRREYAKVESLRRGRPAAAGAHVSVPAPAPSFRSFSAREFAQSPGVALALAAGGAGLGALLGTFVLPGPGTLIGAALGAFVGAHSSNALEKAKSAGRTAMLAEVDRLFLQVDQEMATWLRSCRQAEAARIASLSAELSARYEPGVRKAIGAAREQQRKLELERRELDDLATDLRKRIRALTRMRNSLRNLPPALAQPRPVNALTVAG